MARSRTLANLGKRAASALFPVLLLTGCTLVDRQVVQPRGELDELSLKVTRLERALSDLQRGSTPDAQTERRVEQQGKNLADLRARADDLSAQAASLSGRVEALERAAGAAREASRAGQTTLETKVADLEKKLEKLQALANRPPAEPAPKPAAVSPSPEPAPPPPQEKKLTPQMVYDDAYALYRKQGRHDEARDKFKLFVQTYPDSSLVPNAYFWIGESYYDQRQYEAAILEYENVITKFPKSDKVPSALLKQAFAFDAMGDPVGAKTLLKKLLREHPKSDQAIIAQKKLDTLGE